MKVMFIVNNLGINEPFGPMILSAILRQKKHNTILGVLQKENVEDKILSWKPDLLAYSMMSVDMKEMKKFNDSLRKRKKIFTLLGGPHATLDRSCIDDPGIDAICIGEGEEAIINVIERLEKKKDIEAIPNILTPGRPDLNLRRLIEDFDEFPFMDRELVYSYPEMARFGIKGIWTSRGCAFPCPFCFNNRYNELFKKSGKVVRRRSVDSIIKETRELVSNYRVNFIRIQDDVFVYKVDDWLKEFSEEWPKEIGIPFYCLLRAELITDEMAFYLKKAGCFSVCMSIEAADDDVRMRMMRRRATRQQLENAFRILKKHRINVYANTIIGLPFTSIEDDICSLDFAIKMQPDMPNFSIFMPYPGTDLGDYCLQAGVYDPKKDNIDYGMRNMSPLKCFSDKEKKAQYNLCTLGIIAVKFPILRNLIIRYFIYFKPNKIFFLMHYMFAISAYGRKIFYFQHTFGEYFELIARTLKHYFYDFTMKKKSNSFAWESRLRIDKAVLSDEDKKREFEKCLEAMSHYSL